MTGAWHWDSPQRVRRLRDDLVVSGVRGLVKFREWVFDLQK
jgi:hypothetical protein